ncbi:hypothetical protein CERSUDRAFT_116284 [Gelatoporia subvermispora B]|uniref:RRM domain-containing protein n=1 Tax=Ceriporiopsis subvermispora (strain B) TaxID=914234 RepID=M2RAU7_CERS8|nr:hypothetical protein CERSUDRAFT_116284 [Gelatoporia subvermispora B]
MAPFDKSRKPYSRPAARPRGADGEWLHDKAPGVPSAALNTNGNGMIVDTSSKILVSNLHYELTPKDLTQIFGQAGTLVREPLIRYDRSGRSSGVAIVSFETVEEATLAKQRFDGKLAKGQPMTIEFYSPPPKPVKGRGRSVSAPSSLLNRIEKPPLLERLSRNTPKEQIVGPRKSGPGPIRTKARPAATRAPKKAKTADELDKELEMFMLDDAKASAPPQTSATTQADGDVEMT